VVISLEIRADRDLDEVTEELRSRVERVYRWAGGICRPATCGSVSVSYLGPPGTFSEVAAHRCVEAIAVKGARLTARESMEEVLAAIAHDEIAVLPISSSSSGLVSRAVASLLRSSVDFVAGGMIDVPVRLDAYSRPGLTAESLRGSRVYSHPQALAQCTAFIQRLHLEPVACESTVEALTRCAQDEEPSAAVASTDTDVESLGLTPVKREVDDVAGAITRFLVLGTENSFGRLSEHFMPTERALVVGRITAGAELRSNPRPSSQEEWITDSDGNFLLVTSDLDYRPSDQATARLLGIVPWSPRTPIVRVGDAVVPTS
jgi:prephenate dehydratase